MKTAMNTNTGGGPMGLNLQSQIPPGLVPLTPELGPNGI